VVSHPLCYDLLLPMYVKQFQYSAGDKFCRDSDFQHSFADGFHSMLGTMVATERCQNVEIFNDIDYTVNNFLCM